MCLLICHLFFKANNNTVKENFTVTLGTIKVLIQYYILICCHHNVKSAQSGRLLYFIFASISFLQFIKCKLDFVLITYDYKRKTTKVILLKLRFHHVR